jgi:hypothetical protein
MTMAGALSPQARAVLNGKDPEAMDNGEFWKQAALQGGALGIEWRLHQGRYVAV